MAPGRRFTKGAPKFSAARTLLDLAKLLGDFAKDVIDALGGHPTPHADTHRPDRSRATDDPLATDTPQNATGPVALPGNAGTLMRSDATIKQGIVTIKGQLVGHNATVPAAVPAPVTNGHVLTADSAEATGMKWAASSAEDAEFLAWASVMGAL